MLKSGDFDLVGFLDKDAFVAGVFVRGLPMLGLVYSFAAYILKRRMRSWPLATMLCDKTLAHS